MWPLTKYKRKDNHHGKVSKNSRHMVFNSRAKERLAGGAMDNSG
jgi:hypothetical protein